jgi:hypothetical protein
LKNGVDMAVVAQKLEDTAVAFCVHATATTPITMPVNLKSVAATLEYANQYKLGFVSTYATPNSRV